MAASNVPAADPQTKYPLEGRQKDLENAWRQQPPGSPPPRWQEYLPAPEEACNPDFIFLLIQTDINFRIKAGLTALLNEPYLQHPRLQAADVRLDNGRRVELIRWEYQQRWARGDWAARDEYIKRFPEYALALQDLKALWNCARCGHTSIPLDAETAATVVCPRCQEHFPIDEVFALPWPMTADTSRPESPVRTGGGDDLASLKPAPVLPSACPHIPGFEILGELGRGGMGVVYKARQVSLNRIVALKMVLAGAHARPEDLARFLIEAEAVAHLQHPSIVQIFDVGEHAGLPFFALEYLEGGSLHQKLQGTPLPAREAAQMVAALALAMYAAHERGIIHRDLKPANILLDREGRPKITDFGLAKRVEGGPSLTQANAIMGTPSYMAPEQASGQSKAVGPAADIYALGAILYELLTGRPPFRAPTPPDTLFQVLHEEPIPLRRLQPKLPRDLETICLKCLRKDARQRYASAQALAEDVRRFLAGEAILARPVASWERSVKWARRRPAVTGLLTALVVVLVGGLIGMALLWQQAKEAAAQAFERQEEAEIARREALIRAYVENSERFTADRDLQGATTQLSKVSQLLKPGVPIQEEAHRARLTAFLSQCPRLLQVWAHPKPVSCADFSPDGRWVATACADGSVRIWEVATGKMAVSLEYGGRIHRVVFSPDSQQDRLVIAASQDHAIQVWNQATERTITLPLDNLPGREEPGLEARVHVAFSADGRRLVSSGDGLPVKVWSIKLGKLVWELPPKERICRAVFSPNGKWVATAGQYGHARLRDVNKGVMAKTFWHSSPVLDIGFSPDSRLVVTTAANRTTCVWDVNTSRPVTWIAPNRIVQQVAFSPDGLRVLATEEGEECRVSVWDARTGQPLTSLVHGHVISGAAFSPDGRYIVTGSVDHTAAVMYVMTGQFLIPPLKHAGAVRSVAFSPDGRCILVGGDDGTVRLWDVHPSYRGNLALRHAGMVHFAAFSPDGRRIVTTCEDGRARIWDAASGRPMGQPLQHDGPVLQAAFSRDGEKVVTASADKTARVWQVAGAPAAPPLKHPGAVLAAFFGPDANSVTTVCTDKKVRVWDLANGQPRFFPFASHKAPGPPGMPIEAMPRVFEESFLVGLVSGLISEQPEPSPAPNPVQPPTMQPGGMRPAQPPVMGAPRLGTSGNMAPGMQPGTAPGMQPGTAPGMQPGMAPGMAPETAPTAPTPTPGTLTPGAAPAVAGTFTHPSAGQTPRAEAAAPSPGAISVTGGQSQPRSRFGMQASMSLDRQWVVVTFDRAAQLWDAKTGRAFGPELKANVSYASFNPKEAYLVLVGGHQAQVWDFVNAKSITSLLQHPAWVYHAAFSPDGLQLATACRDGIVRVWDVATGRKVAQTPGQGGPVHEVAFSSDGRRIVSVSYDRTVRVWDAATGEPLTPSFAQSGGIVHADISPDGNKLLTASLDGIAHIWDLSALDLVADANDLVQYTELLAGRQTDLKGGEVFLDAATLSNSFQTLKGESPSLFTLSRAEQIEWHHQEAAACAHEAAWGTISGRRISPLLMPEDQYQEKSPWWFAAACHLDHLIKADPANGSYYRRRARAYLGMRKWGQAVDDYTKAIGPGETDREIRHYRAWAYAQLGKWDRAVEDFTAAVQQTPDDPIAWLGLSMAHSQLKQWDKAEFAYGKASVYTKTFLIRGDVRLEDCQEKNVFPDDSVTIALDFIRSRMPVARPPKPARPAKPETAPAPMPKRAIEPETAPAPKPKGEEMSPLPNRLQPIPVELPKGDVRNKAEWWVHRAGGLINFALGNWDFAKVDFRKACELKPGNWHNWYGLFRIPHESGLATSRFSPEPAGPPREMKRMPTEPAYLPAPKPKTENY
jgi:WD40 repeat protein/tetratricopeptide (TPR) repeat protein/tRNA A-37 threonylcarbamoyl transferase component Bud32